MLLYVDREQVLCRCLPLDFEVNQLGILALIPGQLPKPVPRSAAIIAVQAIMEVLSVLLLLAARLAPTRSS